MSFNPLEYKGNAIFRNQPNHTYFDKSFDDGGMDPLFLLLNDIDPYFWQPEERAKTLNLSSVSIIDPRTKKSITQLVYDHTNEEVCKIFQSPERSLLTVQQHKMCVQAINCMQRGQTVEEEQLYNWYSTQKKRQREKELFQKYVAEFCQTNREHMYKPCRKLFELYQKWYSLRSRKLMKRYPKESYNTDSGLPHLRLCKDPLKEMQVQICEPQIVANLGVHNKWEENSHQEISKLNHVMDNYHQTYINSEDKHDELEAKLHNLFLKKIEEEKPNESLYYIPLESLLFLLTAGDYVDLPTEILLNITDITSEDNETRKMVIMDLPLPSRQIGWHSYQQVLEESVIAMLSINQSTRNQNLSNETEKQAPNEVENIYKVFTLEEYMQNCRASPEKLCQFSKTLIKWQLKPTEEEDTYFSVYTSILTPPVKSDDPDNLLSLKLEFKPHFGCEIKTKYQLLKEWLHFKLLEKTKTTCFRVDITNYQTLLQEDLTVQKIEENLSTYYHINCQQLLEKLFEFLKMLYNMPCGHYMLRFNNKFKDKLLLCKPAKEISQNTVHLHQLLETDVLDILFNSQQCFLPIDDTLCSLMHLEHNIIPCCFSPLTVVPKGALHKQTYNKICANRKRKHTADAQYKCRDNAERSKKTVIKRKRTKKVK